MAEDKKKYNYMEQVLNKINSKYLSLSDVETKRNNEILKEFLDKIIPKMKEKDSLFKEMYTSVFYGGSFYDGLRVGEPSEFDLDLLLVFPKLLNSELSVSNKPGYLHMKVNNYIGFLTSDLAQRYKGIHNLINEKTHYLETKKVLAWMESLVKRAIDELPKENNQCVIPTKYGKFFIKVVKSGPAFTLKANGIVNNKRIDLDVDLVPCFLFTKDKWPTRPYRPNSVQSKTDFFIVPKPLKNESGTDHYWRLSFQQQERVIIDSKKTLKPTVKLLKQMRDRWDHKCIASYYIKTVLLWEAEGKRDVNFWNSSLSYVFMTMLKEYQKCLAEKKIKYFWNEKNNLLGGFNDATIANINNKIKAIIDDIDKHPGDALVVAKHLLPAKEFNNFKDTL